MGTINKQKKLTGGKGWSLVKTIASPITHLRNLASAAAFKRARTKKGHYRKDDKSTPFWNEAWAKGSSPKKGKNFLSKFVDWILK